MKSRFDTRMVRDLTVAIGLPVALIALLLACAAETAPPVAAAPAHSELRPAWTSSDPVTKVIAPADPPWVIDPYGVIITFTDEALREVALFTFTPRPDLHLDPPYVSTPYIFELKGNALGTGLSISLWGDAKYDIQYDDSHLNRVSESTLRVFRFSERWYPISATVDTTANRITWDTNFTGKFGVGGFGSLDYINYYPAMFNAGTVRSARAGSQPTD